MTPRLQKVNAAKKANAESHAAQTIQIDDNWQIHRADSHNWEIQFKGEFKGYYGTLLGAINALPAKMLDETAKNSLADVIGSQKAILALLKSALAGVERKQL